MDIEVYVDGVQYLNAAVFPFGFSEVLVATLDSATITVCRVPNEIIEILTDVTVVVKSDANGEQSFSSDWLVSHDDSVESPVGSGLYNHTLSLIELTKFSEGFIGDSLCITHPGGNVYTENAKPVEPEET